ncbi:hypothetical protein EYZ11_012574 [Aspergillus tanneri]|nr:hypothetical protein EYZ11_012574 [Aspergillus tanneri]
MQSQFDRPDFLLFPVQSTDKAPMLALDSSRQQQTPYFQHFTMDPAMIESFGFHVDNLNGFGQAPTSANIPQSSYYDTPPVYTESFDANKGAGLPPMPATPPSIPTSRTSDAYMPGLCTASGPSVASASSSAIGSPYSSNAQIVQENWIDTSHGLGLPAAVMGDLYDYMGNPFDSDGIYGKKYPDSFVDPSMIQPMQQQHSHLSPPELSYTEQSDFSLPQAGFLPQSPAPQPLITELYSTKHSMPRPPMPASPSLVPSNSHPVSTYDRRSSISSIQSRRSQPSPAASSPGADEDGKEKDRCPHPDCGRVFKDLKAHMLTHQSERPEKCPIVTCEYHFKGFARKYDKNRHTLTHYKGTMVCGFCPGSGSPAEKSFNRADVFKRHLTSVHGVEQTPPNCRKRSPVSSTNKGVTGYCHDATGKCSTCSATFSNAQDFYEHLDDCVLRVVQQEEPSEAINQQRLAEVESDEEVKKTMEKHMLLDTAGTVDRYDDDNDDDDDSNDFTSTRRSAKSLAKAAKGNSGTGSRPILGNNVVAKRATGSKRRNNRDRYPQSWGCPSSNIKTKKRVLCVFDGQRRLWKDEMMLDSEFEVRLKLPGGAGDGTNREAYVTDLDVETLKRAEGVLSANDEERGSWMDGPSNHLIGQPAMILPDYSLPREVDVDIEELMS